MTYPVSYPLCRKHHPQYLRHIEESTEYLSKNKSLGKGKTTGDISTTRWEDMVNEISFKITKEYISSMKMHEKIPILNCINVKDISKMESYVPAVLKKIDITMWEIWDENEDKILNTIEFDGDEGLNNSWGLYLKQPNVDWCRYYQGLRMMDGETQEDKTHTQETSGKQCKSTDYSQ